MFCRKSWTGVARCTRAKHTKTASRTSNLKLRTDLPPPPEWPVFRDEHPQSRIIHSRPYLFNKDGAMTIANAFVPHGSKDKVVIETFPGSGYLTRALLSLPKERISKLIVMDNYSPFVEMLKPLEKADPRVHVVLATPWAWDAYQNLEKDGLFDGVAKLDWHQGVHPHLQYISQLPVTTMSEQFISQLYRSMPDRGWLFKYGRVPLNFLMPNSIWQKIQPKEELKGRTKVNVVGEVTANTKLSLPADSLSYNENFKPRPVAVAGSKTRTFTSMLAAAIEPLEHQIIQPGTMDAWDYVLRKLFVRKTVPLKTGMSSLAIGAQTLLSTLTDPSRPEGKRLDVERTPASLTGEEWKIVVDVFREWPFAPSELEISDTLSQRTEKHG